MLLWVLLLLFHVLQLLFLSPVLSCFWLPLSPSPDPCLLTGLARRVSIYLDRSKQGGEC